jgi:hypothetical protein
MVEHSRRNVAATRALSERSGAASVVFTGTELTAEQLMTHARSEAAIHRWDLVGDDDVSDELLAQPELTDQKPVTIDAGPAVADEVNALLWPAAQPWPPIERR